jgi:hypothetical protein
MKCYLTAVTIAGVTALMVDKSNVNVERRWNNIYRGEKTVVIPFVSPQILYALG